MFYFVITKLDKCKSTNYSSFVTTKTWLFFFCPHSIISNQNSMTECDTRSLTPEAGKPTKWEMGSKLISLSVTWGWREQFFTCTQKFPIIFMLNLQQSNHYFLLFGTSLFLCHFWLHILNIFLWTGLHLFWSQGIVWEWTFSLPLTWNTHGVGLSANWIATTAHNAFIYYERIVCI